MTSIEVPTLGGVLGYTNKGIQCHKCKRFIRRNQEYTYFPDYEITMCIKCFLSLERGKKFGTVVLELEQ